MQNPSTPQAVIPDLYVGVSPSLSSHFLTTNIAFPSHLEHSILSPSTQLNLGDSSSYSPSFSYPQSPMINFFTPYSDKRSKAKKQLSAQEFNDMFSGQLDSPTKLRRSASILKRKLNYSGTVENFDKMAFSLSQPCTPVRDSNEITEAQETRRMTVTPMRYQYRLNQMRNRRAVLLKSPLRRRVEPTLSRSLFNSFNESSRSTLPTLPKAVENMGNYSIHSVQAASNLHTTSEASTNNTIHSQGGSSVLNANDVFEFVGSLGGLNRHHPEVLLDCDGTMISMKEVSLDQLLTIKQRMTPKTKDSASHFIL